MATEKHYPNQHVTIVWQPELCTHSTKCWRGLPEVFKPKEKPWIHPENASADAIVDQVSKCPSGALSYFHNEKS